MKQAGVLSLLAATTTAVVLLCGCASIVSDSNYAVSIRSTPTGADIWVTDQHGEPIYSGKTPATVTLQAGDGYFKGAQYTVRFTLEGYQQTTVPISCKLDGWYMFGNLVIGGLLGYVVIDPLTGAMWKLEEGVHASLHEQASMRQPRELRIVSLSQVPLDQRENLIPIKGVRTRHRGGLSKDGTRRLPL